MRKNIKIMMWTVILYLLALFVLSMMYLPLILTLTNSIPTLLLIVVFLIGILLLIHFIVRKSIKS